MRLEGRSVLLTGATGGIGGAIARDLASRGCALTLTGRREPDLERLVNELGPPARGFASDLTTVDGIHDLLARSQRVDVLVANAGIEIPQDLVAVTEAELDEAIRVNLLAPAALARAALPQMIKRGAGHLVFMSSVAGLVATPGNGSVYTATKWGLRGLGLALRQELHGTGVGVSTIFPGPIRDAGMFARSGVRLPWGRGTSSPADVAKAVARAIERNRPETTVAAGVVRLSQAIGAVAPVLIGTLARLAGAGRVRQEMIASRSRGDGSAPSG
jgi:short-subunit dehydrogenase